MARGLFAGVHVNSSCSLGWRRRHRSPAVKDCWWRQMHETLSKVPSIAAEARAKIIYRAADQPDGRSRCKRCAGLSDDQRSGTPEILRKGAVFHHAQLSPGKLPGMPDFTDKYYDMSQGEGNLRGSWNQGEQWEFVDDRELQAAVDGGDGLATVKPTRAEKALKTKVIARTMSDPTSDPFTRADLGAGPGAGTTMSGKHA